MVLSFQAYTSVSKASLGLADHRELGKMMNTIIFHTKMVDSLVEMLVETSDLSIFWYATNLTVQVFLLFFFNCPCKCNYLNSTLCREIGQWKNWLEFLVSSRISLEKVFMNIYWRYSPSSHIIDQESFADFCLILFCKKCKFFAVPMWQMSK